MLSSIHAIGADGKPDGPSLEPLIQFGWLGLHRQAALSHPALHGRATAFANWGWAIIIFTAVFTLLMLPTRIMMMQVVAEDDAHPAQGRRHQEALRAISRSTTPSAPR